MIGEWPPVYFAFFGNGRWRGRNEEGGQKKACTDGCRLRSPDAWIIARLSSKTSPPPHSLEACDRLRAGRDVGLALPVQAVISSKHVRILKAIRSPGDWSVR